MPLSDLEVRKTPPGARDLKLFDGHGLYLLIRPGGSRLWRFKYRIAGHEKLLALGIYPDTSLKLARERRDEARCLLASGVDPSAARHAQRSQRCETLEALAREWLNVQAQGGLAARTLTKKTERFEAFVFPYIGTRPIAEITGAELLFSARKGWAYQHRPQHKS